MTRALLVYSLTLLALLLAAWLSLLAFSQHPLMLSGLWQGDDMSALIVRDVRLPRMLACALVGLGLGMAGSLLQAVTRNALASPHVLGINQGAGLFVALSLGVLQRWQLPTLAMACAGATLSGALVLLLSGLHRGRASGVRLVLSGVALSSLLAAMTDGAVMLNDELGVSIVAFMAGSVDGMTWQQVAGLWPWVLGATVGALLLAHPLNLLQLGDEAAHALGLKTRTVRVLCALLVVVVAGAVVTYVGAIAFVCLIVPHTARALLGRRDLRLVLPLAGLLGGVLMLLSDALSRLVNYPFESPVGIVTALIGAPFFLYLTWKQRR